MNNASSTTTGAQERARVYHHLAAAEHMARTRQVSLDPLRTANRSMLLDELRRYRQRGRFPLNHGYRTRAVPQFIDSHGTPCAVAHLMELSGQGPLVRQIAQTENSARVGRLARLPELRAWLTGAGLSLDEAARIQPSYCFISEAEACFCKWSERTSLALGTIIADDYRTVQVRVDRVEGDFPGLDVGDQQLLPGPGKMGEQLLFSRTQDAGPAQRVASGLVIDGNLVRCQLNGETERRPIAVDTIFQALLAEHSSCVNILATDNSAWNQSQCSEAESADAREKGCGLAPTVGSSFGALDLTSAALFAALVAYRRKRGTKSSGR
jgi:hypothetical protein